MLTRGVVRQVPVAPLSAACAAEQATAAGREPAETYALTGGNPLLVTELLAAAGPGVPANVRDVVLARLAALPPPAREIARLVAVMPRSAEAAVLGGLEEPVDACLAAGLLVSRADAVSYRHELLRRAVEDALSPAARAALHRRVLALLTGLDGTDPARLAHHALHAGDADAVLRHGTRAAARAAAHGAHREAVAHYRAVRPYVGRLTGPERADLLEAYAVQAYLANDADEGLDALRDALAEWERAGDRIRVGAILRWTSRLAWWSGHSVLARQAATRAVRVLEAAGEPGRELAMAYSNRSQLHMLAHELPAAIEWGERARELAERVGDTDTSLHAASNVATARLQSGHPSAGVTLRRLHAEAAAAGFPDHAARALVNRAASLVEGSDYVGAEAAVDEALRYVAVNHLDGYLKYLFGVRAGVRLERAEWDAALGDAEESLARPGGAGQTVVPALVAKARILSARGNGAALSILDRAAAVAEQLDELQRIGPVADARAEHSCLPANRAAPPPSAARAARDDGGQRRRAHRAPARGAAPARRGSYLTRTSRPG
ncbi:MAG TPA: hypothetical protein VI011_01060 [Asanoa sp.]